MSEVPLKSLVALRLTGAIPCTTHFRSVAISRDKMYRS